MKISIELIDAGPETGSALIEAKSEGKSIEVVMSLANPQFVFDIGEGVEVKPLPVAEPVADPAPEPVPE